MKMLLAALVLRGQASDETSLMQGLARRVEGKLGTSGGHDTAKLMETATKMLKNGAGVTPDVAQFIEATISRIDDVVLPAILHEHATECDAETGTIRNHIRDQEAIVETCATDTDALFPSYGELAEDVRSHHECRQAESHKCGESRRCERELQVLWSTVKREERVMREIHDQIHGEICVHPWEYCAPCMGDSCWDWPNVLAQEGPETSQTEGSYPVVEYCQELRDGRSTMVNLYTNYLRQKPIVERAWETYNTKLLECAAHETELESAVAQCDALQDAIQEPSCALQQQCRDLRRGCGRRLREAHEEYDTSVGVCTNAADEHCDINTAPAEEECTCTGIRQTEFDRKREWETLHVVKCLLNTVYTNVVHAIETNEPCPTIESHPDETQAAINTCHIIDDSLTAHLVCQYCGDDAGAQLLLEKDARWAGSALECPAMPPLCESPDEQCSAAYNYNTIGHFGDFVSAHAPALSASGLTNDFNVDLSPAGWGGCAAPKACNLCVGHGAAPSDPLYTARSNPCEEDNRQLGLGESDRDTFRCHGTWCVPIQARCNGVENCYDGSDEWGCEDTLVPVNLQQSFQCPAGSPEALGVQDDVHFFCNDGSCIPVEGRCNGFANCGDGSDEQGCSATVAGVSVEPTTGHPASLETISEGGHVFTDRTYTFKSLGSFHGMSFVKMSNEDKSTPHSHVQMKLRLPQPMTVYVTTTEGQTLPWLAAEGWTQLQWATVPEYSGERVTPPKEWSGHRDAIDREEDHYGNGAVYEKTFPAGVAHLRGNGGGEGYLWSDGEEGGHGSYLIFVAHPSHRLTAPAPPPAPVPEPEYDCALSAYWEYGNCGCGGNDQNQNWCGGIGSGNCPDTIETSICPSGTAYLAEWHPKPYGGSGHAGRGTAGHLVRDGCEYIWHAQYACQAEPSPPVAPAGYEHVEAACVHGNNIRLVRDSTPAQCAELCDAEARCVAFEFGVDYGASGRYSANDCQLQSSSHHSDCNGREYNLDLYVKLQAEPECQVLHNQDIVAGTFAHYGADRMGAASSDAECSALCTASPECTAWVRQPSSGNCWLTRQSVPVFEADTDRNTGLRCEAATTESFSCTQGAQNNHNQLGSFRGYTKERCEQECLANPACLSYDTSANDGGNECYLSTTTAATGGGLRANDARYEYCERA